MAAEGYGPAQKFFVYRDADGWCISCRLWPERRSRDEQGLLRTGFSMSGKRHPHVAQLTLVATANADEIGRDGSGLDWSRLMARAQDGDRQAYRALLEDVTPYVRSLAARCFSQPSDIEDAVQDVLLTVHMIRHAYDPKRPFGPWLVAIANRRIIDRLRRETRQKAREVALSAEHETFPEFAANLDERLSEDTALIEAMATLPPEQRQAVTLLKLNDMSLKEAAAASGRSITALKVATHRAIKTLRSVLKQPSE
jgi:RNA polymerase sigma-70 factor, ECF subfamily